MSHCATILAKYSELGNGQVGRITLHKYGNFPNFIANPELDYEVTGFTQSQRVYTEGGVYDWRIPGSMMAIPREHPEVVVTVNKMRSGCERRESDWVGDACSFDFTEEATLEMANIVISGQPAGAFQVAANDIINFAFYHGCRIYHRKIIRR